MKVLVTYVSQTGNTKKVAEAIYDGIDEDKQIMDMGEATGLDEYDLTFIGFPIVQFNAPEDVQKFLTTSTAGKDIALFMTHGAPEDAGPVSDWISTIRNLAKGANIVGTFNCQGEVSQKIMDMLKSSSDPQMQAFADMCASGKGQPDEAKLQKARVFAKDIISQKKAWTE
ncbi:flavodoxin/nitric oxide synthase [Methanosalsum zhilinae DSM 4017]|uniref:Flavodoxin/nitric oxide synthase n=1 Tax=Methanosalsum zhilinae (strain DSM 4017 / NBRC 107636 / OCM 62 / WeN5) TaxID=679901 RepID=F7XNJ9_METZD|nr:flavodoxin family protein [Methanosalsum zhilinae]AEH60096.1 flavodoxin/nitric oxide synthase [Methanosalsum zhilinae DSM 4017]